MNKGYDANGTWRPNGRGFSMAVVQGPGHVIHFTGQVAWDENEQLIGRDDVGEQTRQCFRNIEAVLKPVGGKLEDIVAITTYFTDRAQLPVIQKMRLEFLSAGNEPASTSVMVAGLGHEDFLVELAPIAVIPDTRYNEPKT